MELKLAVVLALISVTFNLVSSDNDCGPFILDDVKREGFVGCIKSFLPRELTDALQVCAQQSNHGDISTHFLNICSDTIDARRKAMECYISELRASGMLDNQREATPEEINSMKQFGPCFEGVTGMETKAGNVLVPDL